MESKNSKALRSTAEPFEKKVFKKIKCKMDQWFIPDGEGGLFAGLHRQGGGNERFRKVRGEAQPKRRSVEVPRVIKKILTLPAERLRGIQRVVAEE